MTQARLEAFLKRLVAAGLVLRSFADRVMDEFLSGVLSAETIAALDRADRLARPASTREVEAEELSQPRQVGTLAAFAVAALGNVAVGRLPALVRRAAQDYAQFSGTASAWRFTQDFVRTETGRVLALASAEDRRQASQLFASQFREDAYALAQEDDPGRWLLSSARHTREHHYAQTVLGTGRPLTYAERVQLDRRVRRELRYLRGFASEIQTRDAFPDGLLDSKGRRVRQMTVKQKGARLTQYAGEGIAQFYRGSEGLLTPGYVCDYDAQDDVNTCPECAAAAPGPYLPGQGPMPGVICRARGLCRCQRRERFDPVTYARLLGERAQLETVDA